MKRKRDALSQQIAENNRESTVFLLTGRADEQPVRLERGHIEAVTDSEIGTGFFVGPDTIVTTIGILAGAIATIVIPGERFTRASTRRKIQSIGAGNYQQDVKDIIVEIEGVTAFDPKNNLAVLKIAETGVPLPLGNSNNVQIGENVWTLEYQDKLRYAGTAGTLQSRYKEDKWLQIKTQFSSGTGGSPLLNSESEVVGVVAYGTESELEDNSEAIMTAISSNVLKELLAQSGKVMPLDRFQKHSRVHAYTLEAQASKKAKLYDNRGAIKSYNAALKLNPDLVEIYFKRGIVKTRIDDTTGALRDFDKMLRINPGHIFAYNNRASTKGHLEDVHGALDDINQAIALDPEYVMAHVNLGGVNLHIAKIKTGAGDFVEADRHFQEAIDVYRKALKLDRKNRIARKNLRNAKRMFRLFKILRGIKKWGRSSSP